MAKRGGYIKLFRALAASEMWTKEPFTRGQAWVDLLLLANFAPGHIRVRGNRVDIGRGQVGWSVERLAERWMWSKGKLLRFLKELETDQQIERQKSFVSSVLTITNYEKYQKMVRQTERKTDGKETSRQNGKRTADRTADDTADGTLKKKKEINKQQQPKAEVPAEPAATTWEDVVVVLKREGVEMAEQAVVAAKRNGNTPRDILSLVEHYQRNKPAWHPGILKNKVCSIHEGGRVTWPKSEIADKQVAAAKSTEKANEVAAQRRQREAEREAERVDNARLEQRFGHELDQRTPAQVKAFVREQFGTMAPVMIDQLPAKGPPPSGAIRTAILKQIEQLHEDSTA